MRILILEDDPLIALDLQAIVEGCGHEVVDVCDCLADAGGYIAGALDFVFLDIDLPDGKSFGVAERLDARSVPFAFVSASHQGDLPANLRHARFIAKPYQHAAICNTLHESGRVSA